MGQRSNQALRNATIIIVVGILATTLPQTEVLARLPLQNLLKNELHLNRSANAAFFFWIGLAWYLKPLVGIVTDAFPLFGNRRRSYLLIGALLAAPGFSTVIFYRQQNELHMDTHMQGFLSWTVLSSIS